jgi:hypothetical protein
MSTAKNKVGEPYSLENGRIVFTSWYYVRPCSFGWYDNNGKNVSVFGEQGPNDAYFVRNSYSWGVELSVKNAIRTKQFVEPEHPWEEGGLNIFTILEEGGTYRAWGETGWGDLSLFSGKKKYLCYLESKDGMNWIRPDCGMIQLGDGFGNNLLVEDLGGTVFVDPSAPESERYKLISEHYFKNEEYEQYKKTRPDDIDWKSERRDVGLLVGARGAVSHDGIRWELIKQPLVMMHTDTMIVAYYDAKLKKYVGYFRDWNVGTQDESVVDEKRASWVPVGRRVIGRAETEDFRNFPLSDVILEPRLDMGPNKVLYTNCKTTIPGAPDIHLMFPAVWDVANDTTSIEVASSNDGKSWSYISKTPVFETGAFGEWDGGCIFAFPNLIELPNGDFALPYTGYNVPHKYPRKKATRGVGYALWPKGRMAAIEAKGKGEFETVSIVPPGKKLIINAVTSRAGKILVEAADIDGKTIEGNNFENAVPIIGDNFRTPVVWKEHESLNIKEGQAVRLRFKLDEAAIYCLDFV